MAGLAAQVFVAALGVTPCAFPVFGDGVSAAFAVTGLAGDVSLALSIAPVVAALMVGAVPRAHSEVVLGAAVGAENVFRALDVQRFEGRGLRYRHLDVKAAVPAVKRRARAVVLHWDEADGPVASV